MTNQQKETIYNDTKWIKIIFRSSYSSGELIMKKSLYEIKSKKIEKEFKGMEYHIIPNHHLTLEEVINMDDKLNHYDRLRCHYMMLFMNANLMKYYNLPKDYQLRYENIKNEYKLKYENAKNEYEKRLKELKEEYHL